MISSFNLVLAQIENNNSSFKFPIEENEKSIKLIEWPKIINLNVRDRLEISFYYSGKKENERKIKVQGFGEWKGFKINDI